MHRTKAGRLAVWHNSDWSGLIKIGYDNEDVTELPGPEFYALALRIALVALEYKAEDALENWKSE